MKISIHRRTRDTKPDRIVRVFIRWLVAEICRYMTNDIICIDEYDVNTDLVMIRFSFTGDEYIEYTITDTHVSIGSYSTADIEGFKLIERLINQHE